MSKVQKWCRSFSILGRHENKKLWPRSQPHKSAYNNKCWTGKVSEVSFDQKSTFVINHFMKASFTSLTTIINLNFSDTEFMFAHLSGSDPRTWRFMLLMVIISPPCACKLFSWWNCVLVLVLWSHFDFYETLLWRIPSSPSNISIIPYKTTWSQQKDSELHRKCWKLELNNKIISREII